MSGRFDTLKRTREGDEDSSYSSDLPRLAPKRPKSQPDRQTARLEPKGIPYKDLKAYLYEELEKQEKGESGKKIIFPIDIKAVWAPRYVHSFYTAQAWYEAAWDKTCTMHAYLRIMSILIWIDYAPDKWKDFGQDFIKPERNDERLPFEREELQNFLGDRIVANNFYERQWKFCPLIIQERAEPYRLDKAQQLPWCEEPKEVGRGAFGIVKQHTIAAGYLVYSNRGANTGPIAVAIKTVSDSKVHEKEFSNLRELRGCLSDHKHIMVNIATIIETSGIMSSQTHHLLYELAEYDLNAFLTRPRLTLREERDSRRRGSVPKRNRSLNIQPADLIEASSNLADALDYIHNRLYNNEGRIALAHNDIKPENILVVYPDSTDPSHFFPAGRWKLTDFGLSRIKEPRKSDAELLCAEDALQPSNLTQITHRIQPSVSKTLPKRYPGSYTAPELEQNQNNPQKTDGRKADVWSFGCVLAEVIAYAVRMDERLVLELHGIAKTRFYTDGGKEIKPSIRDFFGQLPERAPEWAKESDNHTWIGSCTKLVEDILQIEPTDRLKAGDIRDRLRDIRRDPTFEKSWTDIGEENSGSPEPTSPVQSDGYFRRRGGTDEDAEQNPQIIVSPASHTTLSRNGRRSERI